MNDFYLRILWLPEQASTIASSIDHLHYWVISATFIVSTACGMTALFFYVRYQRRPGNLRTSFVQPPRWFEPGTIVVTLTAFLIRWAIGFSQFLRIQSPPPDAMDVYVTAKQWMWKFSYPGGPNSIDALHVPANRPVRLLMTSRDVIHSFFVPDFRLKADVVPGRYNQLWFEARHAGRFDVLCAEMCGVGHSYMLGEVVVHEPAEFEAWLVEQQRGLKRRQDVGESPACIPSLERVESIGVVEGDDPDPSPHLVQQLVLHGASDQLRGRPRMRWAMMLRWTCSDPP